MDASNIKAIVSALTLAERDYISHLPATYHSAKTILG